MSRRSVLVGFLASAGVGLQPGCGVTSRSSGFNLDVVLDLGELGRAEAAGERFHRFEDNEAPGWLVAFPAALVQSFGGIAHASLVEGARAGWIALQAKCPHLGCADIAPCESSGWFECQCCESRFTRWGEVRRGPALQGMHMFALGVDKESVVINTGLVTPGFAMGLGDFSGHEPEGPHCIS